MRIGFVLCALVLACLLVPGVVPASSRNRIRDDGDIRTEEQLKADALESGLSPNAFSSEATESSDNSESTSANSEQEQSETAAFPHTSLIGSRLHAGRFRSNPSSSSSSSSSASRGLQDDIFFREPEMSEESSLSSSASSSLKPPPPIIIPHRARARGRYKRKDYPEFHGLGVDLTTVPMYPFTSVQQLQKAVTAVNGSQPGIVAGANGGVFPAPFSWPGAPTPFIPPTLGGFNGVNGVGGLGGYGQWGMGPGHNPLGYPGGAFGSNFPHVIPWAQVKMSPLQAAQANMYTHLIKRFKTYYRQNLLPKRPAVLKTHLYLQRSFWPFLNNFPSDGRPDWGPDAPYKGFPPAQARFDYAPKLPISMRPPFHPWFGGGAPEITYAFGRHYGTNLYGIQKDGAMTQLPFQGLNDVARTAPKAPSPQEFLQSPGGQFGLGAVMFGPAWAGAYAPFGTTVPVGPAHAQGFVPHPPVPPSPVRVEHAPDHEQIGRVYPSLRGGTTIGEEVHDKIGHNLGPA